MRRLIRSCLGLLCLAFAPAQLVAASPCPKPDFRLNRLTGNTTFSFVVSNSIIVVGGYTAGPNSQGLLEQGTTDKPQVTYQGPTAGLEGQLTQLCGADWVAQNFTEVSTPGPGRARRGLVCRRRGRDRSTWRWPIWIVTATWTTPSWRLRA